MVKQRSRFERFVLGLALSSAVAGLLLAPSVQASSPLGAGAACADGTCCDQLSAHCVIGSVVIDNAYYKGEGACP